MAVKLSSLAFSRGILRWVHLNAYLSSVSCANSIPIPPETDQTSPSSMNFEAKIQFLKDNIHPDRLVSVLDATSDLTSSLKLFKWASAQKHFQHSADTYYMIILKLGMVGNIDEMEGFCNAMVKEKCDGCEKAFVALINSLVKVHRHDEALRILTVMNSNHYNPSINLFNLLLGALVEEKKDVKNVLFVYKEMVKAGKTPTIDTLNFLLEALLDANQVDLALHQYRRIGNKGCHPNSRTFEILISGLIAANKLKETLGILDEMLSLHCELDLRFFTLIIPALCQLNNLEVALKLFTIMRASEISPNTIIYKAMIHCFSGNCRILDAIEFFREMIGSGIVPTDEVYVDVINGLCKSNNFVEAKKFLVDNDGFRTSPSNALLGAYCNAGNISAALDLFNEMFDRDITSIQSWNILIRGFCDDSKLNNALELLCRMIVASFEPDSCTYSALIIGKCKVGELEDAFVLFSRLCDEFCVLDVNTYAILVECLIQKDKLQEAVQVFCLMCRRRCALQASTIDMLIEAVCLSGRVTTAMKLLVLAYSSGTSFSTAAYNSIIRCLSESDHAGTISAVLSHMVINGCCFDGETYCILIQVLSEIGRTKDCAFLFNLMIKHGVLPNSETLTRLVSSLVKHSHFHVIVPVIDTFVSQSKYSDFALQNILVKGLWKEGYKEKASQLLDLMLEKGWVPDATTHALLMGSLSGEEREIEEPSSGSSIKHDRISSILAEGLGDE